MASLNARVSAVSLIVGSTAALALGFAPDLVPLRFVALGILVFGAWGFADEMGVQKPLNRAGLVAFAFATIAKTLLLLEVATTPFSSGLLLYAFAFLLALLLWSVAFLHRDGPLKIAGLVGASAAIVPILVLIAGHIFVGVGSLWGIGVLYGELSAPTSNMPQALLIIEVVFVFWSLIAGAALWTGQISGDPIRRVRLFKNKSHNLLY